jgi:hypothetical protein
MRKHDVKIHEMHPDEQSTVWLLECTLCGKKSVPITSKKHAEAAIEEISCPADEIAEAVATKLDSPNGHDRSN